MLSAPLMKSVNRMSGRHLAAKQTEQHVDWTQARGRRYQLTKIKHSHIRFQTTLDHGQHDH
jgi:hypothetical protein